MSIQQRPSTSIYDNNYDRSELLQKLKSEKEKGLQNYRLYLKSITSHKSENNKMREVLQNVEKAKGIL